MADRTTEKPDFRQTLTDEYAAFWTAYSQDRDLLRFHYHRPREIWENLKDLSLPRKEFATDMAEVPSVKHFITEDEIDTAMTGGSGLRAVRVVSSHSFKNSILTRKRWSFSERSTVSVDIPMPCPVQPVVERIMTERDCTTGKAIARMFISPGRRSLSASPILSKKTAI